MQYNAIQCAIFNLQYFALLCRNNNFMKETISFRLDGELIKFLKKEAGKDFRSVNNYIEMVLMKHKQEIEAKKTED